MNFFKKEQGGKSTESRNNLKKNWYYDSYHEVSFQRNLFGIVTIFALLSVVFSVISVNRMKSSKAVEPFIIEVEDKDSRPSVIRPLSSAAKYLQNEALQKYFVDMYVSSRESYNLKSFQYNYYNVVRLLSSPSVYSEFFEYFANIENLNSPLKLGASGVRDIKIRSISIPSEQARDSGFVAVVRFIVSDNDGEPKKKVATINVEFNDVVFKYADRKINPLGLQVTKYIVEDDTI